jgi:enamine deaminase RidA (YjgF/YER057c/UK114 family)
VFVAGQIGWDEQRQFPDTLAEQVRQTLQNIVAVLNEANAGPEHLVRLTWYVTSRDEYYTELRQIGQYYREVIGRHFPTMAVVQVVALMEPKAKVEIEATAVVPPTR